MKLPDRYDLAAVAKPLGQKYSFDRISVQEVHGKTCAVASDGRALVVVPVTEMEEGDEPGLYPPAAFTAARERSMDGFARLRVRGREALIESDSDEVADNDSSEARVRSFRCNRDDPLFPLAETAHPSGDVSATIHLSAKRLLELARALGGDESDLLGMACGVALEIRGPDDPVVVRACRTLDVDQDAYGLLMPIHIGSESARAECERRNAQESDS